MSCKYRRALGALFISVGLGINGSTTVMAQQQAALPNAGDSVRLPSVTSWADPGIVSPTRLGPAIDIQPNGAPASQPRGISSLWSGSLTHRLNEPTEPVEAPEVPEVSPVTWSALELAQRTVPQCLYGGADYLLLKPRMGEAVAFYTASPGIVTTDIGINNYNFNYQSSPRVFIGYRDPATGSAIQFTYWNFQETSHQGFTADPNTRIVPNTPVPQYVVLPILLGDTIATQMQLRLNVYDIEFYKPVALNGGRWLMTGSIGARILDYKQTTNATVVGLFGATQFSQFNSLQYTGAGPRASFEARRIVGANGALYVRGGYALLVGTQNAQLQASAISVPMNVNIATSSTALISNADFELGGSWRLGDHIVLSAGWMIASFLDLAGQPSSFSLTNNANIVSFDGLVARAAISW